MGTSVLTQQGPTDQASTSGALTWDDEWDDEGSSWESLWERSMFWKLHRHLTQANVGMGIESPGLTSPNLDEERLQCAALTTIQQQPEPPHQLPK